MARVFPAATGGKTAQGGRGAGDHAARLARVEWLAHAMDSRFRVPGTNIRFGLDALAGLVPGIGDAVSALASASILYDAWKIGVPVRRLVGMAGNILIDAVFGAVPLIGDLFDVGWKANRRNAAVVRGHVEEARRPPSGEA